MLSAATSLDYFSFRDDTNVQLVADWLAKNPGKIRILDCGCRDARLAKALIEAGLEVGRICYFAFDVDHGHVTAAKAERQSFFKGFDTFDVRLRDITDSLGYEPDTFHLILVTNLLHEIRPECIAEMLVKLNDLLEPGGNLVLIDMEELRAEEFEQWAVTFTSEECATMQEAGGFRPTVTKHHKRSVWTYRHVAEKIPSVNKVEVENALSRILKAKTDYLLRSVRAYRDWRDTSMDSQRAACKALAALLARSKLE